MKNRRMNTRNLVIVAMILSLIIGLAVDYVNVHAETYRKMDLESEFIAENYIGNRCKQDNNSKTWLNLQNGKTWLNTELVAVSPGGKDSKATIELMKTDTKVKKGKKRDKVTWKSSNPKVAKIVKIGGKNKETVTIKGLKKGKCKITATYKKNKYECYVIVTNETMLSSYYVHGGKNYTMKVKIINAVPGHIYAWFRENKGSTTWTGLTEKNIWNDLLKIKYSQFEKPENINAAKKALNEPCAVGISANIKIVSKGSDYIYVVDTTEAYKYYENSIQWHIDHKFNENGEEIDWYSDNMPSDYTQEIKKPGKISPAYTHMLCVEPYSNTKGKPVKRTGYYTVFDELEKSIGWHKYHESLFGDPRDDEDYDEEDY